MQTLENQTYTTNKFRSIVIKEVKFKFNVLVMKAPVLSIMIRESYSSERKKIISAISQILFHLYKPYLSGKNKTRPCVYIVYPIKLGTF